MTHGTTTESAQPENGVRPLYANRDFVLFLVCRGFLIIANQVLAVAVGWYIYERTNDVLYLGLVGLFMFLPFFFMFLWAGVAADRFDRRWIIGISCVLHATTVAAIGAWLAWGTTAIWPVFALLLINGTAHTFANPALQATLPALVPRAIFQRAMAASSSLNKISQLSGPALGGLLIVALNEYVFFAAMIFFLFASLAVALLGRDLRRPNREPFSKELLFGGFRHIWLEKIIFGAVTLDLVAVLFGGVIGVLPAIASDFLNVGAEALGVLRAMPAVGGLLVGMALTRFGLPFHAGNAFFVSLIIFSLTILVIGLSRDFLLTAIALAIYGGVDMVSMNVRQTLVQIRTPDALRGRVSAVNAVSVNASNQMGDFRAGIMAATIGVPGAIVAGAAVTFGVTLVWFRMFPDLRRIKRI